MRAQECLATDRAFVETLSLADELGGIDGVVLTIYTLLPEALKAAVRIGVSSPWHSGLVFMH
jgi:hypothetical protein